MIEQFNCEPFLCRHSLLGASWRRFCVACPHRKKIAIAMVIALAVLGLSLAFSLHATRPEMLKVVSKIGDTFKHHPMPFEIAGGMTLGGLLVARVIYKAHAAKDKKHDAWKAWLYEGSGDDVHQGNRSMESRYQAGIDTGSSHDVHEENWLMQSLYQEGIDTASGDKGVGQGNLSESFFPTVTAPQSPSAGSH